MEIKTIQFKPNDGAKEPNLIKIKEIFKKNNFEETDLVLLPELWSTGVDFELFDELSEEIPGKTTELLSNIAEREDIYLIGGSIVEQKNNSLYNTLTCFNRDGDLIEKYRKIHLFSYTNEDKYLSRGKEIKTINTEYGEIGLSICYDLRFPTQYKKMALNGADIFLCPSAWPKERKKHWEILSKSRAIENQSFFISCNRRGNYKENSFIGNSLVIDPMGNILKQGRNKQINKTKIDLNKVKETRKSFPTLRDYIEL